MNFQHIIYTNYCWILYRVSCCPIIILGDIICLWVIRIGNMPDLIPHNVVDRNTIQTTKSTEIFFYSFHSLWPILGINFWGFLRRIRVFLPLHLVLTWKRTNSSQRNLVPGYLPGYWVPEWSCVGIKPIFVTFHQYLLGWNKNYTNLNLSVYFMH